MSGTFVAAGLVGFHEASSYDRTNVRLGLNILTPLAGIHLDKVSTSAIPHTLLSVVGVPSSGNTGGHKKDYNGTGAAGFFSPFTACKCVGSGSSDRAGWTLLAEPGEDSATSAGVIISVRLNGSDLTLSPLLDLRNRLTSRFKVGCDGTVTLTGNIVTGTSTGTILAAAANQKLGFWGKAAVIQPVFIAAPTGGAFIDAECRAAVAAMLTRDANTGYMAAS